MSTSPSEFQWNCAFDHIHEAERLLEREVAGVVPLAQVHAIMAVFYALVAESK